MHGFSNLSVAVIGAGLPVEPVDIGDFESILGDLSPVMKAPDVFAQAQGNQYTLLFMINRASVQVDAPLPEDAEAKLLDAMRFYLKEYAPRSAAGLGHNFQGELDCGAALGKDVLHALMDVDRLKTVTLADPRVGGVTMLFVRGAESRGQLVLGVEDDDSHTVSWSFNFHFDLRQPDSLDVFEALDRFSESRAFAEESVSAMQAWRVDK